MEHGGSRISARSPEWKTTWSACRMFLFSRSRESHPKVGPWEHSRPRVSGPSLLRNFMHPESLCRRTCLNKRRGFGTKDRVMSLILLFLLLLVLIFGVLVFFLRPTSMEKAVEDQLASIEEVQSTHGERTTILKERVVRSPTVEEFAQKLP